MLTPGVEVVEPLDQLCEIVVCLPHREALLRGLVEHVLEDGAAVLQHHVDLPLLLVVQHLRGCGGGRRVTVISPQ